MAKKNVEEKRAPRTWVLARTPETEAVFDMRLQLDLCTRKAKELMRQLELLRDEVSYKRRLMWNEIENALEIGHELSLHIDSDSDMDSLTISEKLQDDDNPEELRSFIRGVLGQ